MSQGLATVLTLALVAVALGLTIWGMLAGFRRGQVQIINYVLESPAVNLDTLEGFLRLACWRAAWRGEDVVAVISRDASPEAYRIVQWLGVPWHRSPEF